MPDWPLASGQHVYAEPSTDLPTSSRGVLLPATTVAHTKNGYTDIVAAANNPGADFALFSAQSSAAEELGIDFSVGAAGSEQIILPNLYMPGSNRDCYQWMVPMRIPAGELIRARFQSEATVSANVVAISVHLFNYGFASIEPCSTCTTWGFNAATTRGVTITCAGTAHTNSAWFDLVTAANNLLPTRYLTISIGASLATIASQDMFMDIGIGTTPDILLGNMPLSVSGTRDDPMPKLIGPLPIQIPSGVRVAVRLQTSVATAPVYYATGHSFA